MMPLIRWLPVAVALTGLVAESGAQPEPSSVQVSVQAELKRLMFVNGFDVRGIEQTAEAVARAEGDELLPRLNLLLEDFDHIIVQRPDQGVERVIILGEKVAYVPLPLMVDDSEEPGTEAQVGEDGEIILPTQRRGASHIVILTLEGADEQRVQQSLLIDTGADQVVLPASLMQTLGLSSESMSNQQVQTANGTIDARIGTLAAVWLGEMRIANVQAAFIDDQRLGGNALLGMSVLGRFRMTIDDEHNQLTLETK